MAREFAKSFYKSTAWQQARDMALLRDHYLCRYCGKLADEVHHKIFLTQENISDLNVTLNLDNLVCLCHNCHTILHKEAENINSDVLPIISFNENGEVIKL